MGSGYNGTSDVSAKYEALEKVPVYDKGDREGGTDF